MAALNNMITAADIGYDPNEMQTYLWSLIYDNPKCLIHIFVFIDNTEPSSSTNNIWIEIMKDLNHNTSNEPKKSVNLGFRNDNVFDTVSVFKPNVITTDKSNNTTTISLTPR